MIFYSGGALGSDFLFETLCSKYFPSHEFNIISFKNHKNYTNSHGNIIEISDELLRQAENYMYIASKSLNKNVPTNEYVRKLILRNFYQIIDCEHVFALCDLTNNNKSGRGGTGWACEYGKQMNKTIYIIDQKGKQYSFNKSKQMFESHERTLKITHNSALIGTRKPSIQQQLLAEQIFQNS